MLCEINFSVTAVTRSITVIVTLLFLPGKIFGVGFVQ